MEVHGMGSYYGPLGKPLGGLSISGFSDLTSLRWQRKTHPDVTEDLSEVGSQHQPAAQRAAVVSLVVSFCCVFGLTYLEGFAPEKR